MMEMIQTYPVLFMICWAWIGACIGSFLNVCIWRIPNDMSIVSPPSHCPKCSHAIPFYENIPVLSWLILRGKCSSCHAPISIRYLLVELLTALIFLRIWIAVSPEDTAGLMRLLAFSVTASVLIAAAFTDCDYRIIPDEFVVTLLIALPVLEAFTGMTGWRMFSVKLLETFSAFLLLSGLAWLGRGIFSRTALGWGDVKLLSVLTFFTGILYLFLILLLASVLTLLCTPLYRKLKPKMRHRAVPFAPFIAAAAGLVCLTPLGSLLYSLILRIPEQS